MTFTPSFPPCKPSQVPIPLFQIYYSLSIKCLLKISSFQYEFAYLELNIYKFYFEFIN